jgi:iron complex outermembrane receptor protein
MLRKKLYTYIFLLLSSFGISQNRLEGKIKDEKDQPIPFCSLGLMKAKDSTLVKGTVTAENGEFKFESVATGDYLIKVTNVGFSVTWSGIIQIDSLSKINIEPIVLKSSAVNLNEIAVSEFKPTIEFKEGVVILNIENNPIANGNTVFDLLKLIPGVTVDANNNIAVNGRSGVRFLIDGRLQQIPASQMVTILNSMSAQSVSVVELIKNPPAKYDASGSAGLINIVTKKAKVKGFSGSVTQIVSQGDRFRSTSAFNLNYKSNKLSIFTNTSYLDANLETDNRQYRVIDGTPSTTVFNSIGHQEPKRSALNYRAGLEYDITEKTSVGVNVSGGPTSLNNVENTNTTIGGSPFIYDDLAFKINTTQKFSSPVYNFNATHKFDTTGTQLVFSTDYTNFINQYLKVSDNNYYNNNAEVAPTNVYSSGINQNFKIYTQKLDFNTEIKKLFELEAGLKSSFVTNASNATIKFTDSTTGQLYVNPLFTNQYQYHERILAGYISLHKSYKNLSARVGIRSEQTKMDALSEPSMFILHRQYLNFFPNTSLDYKINDKNSIQFTYSYRIDRPSYDQLNPTHNFNEQFNYGTGNPSLRPQYSHNLNLDYQFNNFITFTLGYLRTNNFIYNYNFANQTTKVNVDTVFNFPVRNNYSFGIFINKKIKWYNLQLYGAFMYRNLRGTIEGSSANSQTYQFEGNMNNQFMLPKGFKIQFLVYYSSPFLDGIQYYYPVGSIHLVVQRSFFKNKLDAVLGMYDILHSDIHPYSSTLPGQYYYYWEKNDTRRVRFSLTYKFGKMKITQKSQRSNEDESKRIKN